MHPTPAIAIVSPNTLMGLGLKGMLERMIPIAEVELFGDFADFEQATPERFFHFFIAAQLFVAHSAFFREHQHKTILLTNGREQAGFGGMKQLNVFAPEQSVVREIMLMHHGKHGNAHQPANEEREKELLSAREAEVLTLLARGYINKQIADQLNIGLTTVISHRRNIGEKLGIKSTSGLAIYAVAKGYLDAGEL